MPYDPVDAWAKCLTSLRGKLFSQSFDTWLRPLHCQRFDEDKVVLEAPHAFSVSWIEEHYLKDIRSAIRKTYGHSPEVVLTVSGDRTVEQSNLWQGPGGTVSAPIRPADEEGPRKEFVSSTVSARDRSPEDDDTALPVTGDDGDDAVSVTGDAAYTFESFVVGPSNEIAFNAARTIVEAPGKTPFNPLLIYGGVGLGKTHMLQAIAAECLRNGTATSPMYVTSEQFGREFVTSLKEKRTLQFAQRYRKADVLMIDDVQFFEKKERMQEEFFHTFNTLHSQGKQLVLSSDRPPEQMTGLQDRLLSRMHWGLVADIQSPDLETRMAICQKKAELGGMDLSLSIAEYIARKVESNVRELEGIVNRVMFTVGKLHTKLSMEVVDKAVNVGRAAKPKVVNIGTIMEAVAAHFHMPPSALTGASRRADLVLKRSIAMYLCKVYTGESLRAVGDAFGGKSHATVRHACQKLAERMTSDPTLLIEVNSIANALGCPPLGLDDI